jgi:CheY-like chemotaxis protein
MAQMDHPLEEQQHPVKTILVVDDDIDIGAFIVEVLKEETPCQALFVTDGNQALEAVKTVIPDLFILDYQLPGIDGLSLADHFRATEMLKHIPILLMSAHSLEPELEKRDITFIRKPFAVDELLQSIQTLLGS